MEKTVEIDHPDRQASDSKQIGLLLLTLPSLILDAVSDEMSVVQAHYSFC